MTIAPVPTATRQDRGGTGFGGRPRRWCSEPGQPGASLSLKSRSRQGRPATCELPITASLRPRQWHAGPRQLPAVRRTVRVSQRGRVSWLGYGHQRWPRSVWPLAVAAFGHCSLRVTGSGTGAAGTTSARVWRVGGRALPRSSWSSCPSRWPWSAWVVAGICLAAKKD